MAGLHGRILITGGAGYLGRGIMRRARREGWDTQFTVFSRDELKQHLCRDKYPEATYVLGDIRDVDRLEALLPGHDYVIHAAAFKYVPEAEKNVSECVGINIGGSQALLRAARFSGVRRVVGISTDKAVYPVNTYGVTKLVMERLFGEAAAFKRDTGIGPDYVLCRYGNVIGSTGSVVPVFRDQARRIGEITVTDPDMTRFWMSVDDAVDVILNALTDVANGYMVVPATIRSLRLGDLAEAIRDESFGVAPSTIVVVGPRPGEKTHESLLTEDESAYVGEPEGENFFVPTVPFRLIPPTGDVFGYSSENMPLLDAETFLAISDDAATV